MSTLPSFSVTIAIPSLVPVRSRLVESVAFFARRRSTPARLDAGEVVDGPVEQAGVFVMDVPGEGDVVAALADMEVTHCRPRMWPALCIVSLISGAMSVTLPNSSGIVCFSASRTCWLS